MRTSLFSKLWCISSALAGLLTAAGFSAGAAGTQDAGTASLSGHVEFRGAVRAPSYQNDFYSYHPPSSAARRPNPLRAIIYLQGDNLQPSSESPPAIIDQRDEMFVPHILAVQQGTQVDFRNSDAIYHNVFSFSKTKRLDLGRYPKGRSRSVVFDRLGVVRVFCEIHSHMSAFVLVLPHSYFATTDATGNYRIPNVPPGRYDLVVWSDSFRTIRREVRLRSRGATEINFVLEPAR